MKKLILLAGLGLFINRTAIAIESEARLSDRPLSVYRIHPWVDGPLLGAAALGASVPIFLQSKIVHKQCPCDRDEVPAFDRPIIRMHSNAAAWASHALVTLAIATPMVLDYKDVGGFNKTYVEDFVVYAEVLAIDSSLSNLARYTIQRPRPEAYRRSPGPEDSGAFLSFYSGHAASTFAALSAASMTYGYRHGHSVIPWVITGVAGVTEGSLRAAAGKHFISDNIVGMIVGTTVGIVVPMMHKRKGPSTLSLVPADRGAELVWKRTF